MRYGDDAGSEGKKFDGGSPVVQPWRLRFNGLPVTQEDKMSKMTTLHQV